MRVFLAAMVLIAASLALLGQVHPFPGPGGAPNSTPMTGIVASGLVAYWDLSTPYYNAATSRFSDLSGTGNVLCGTSACTGSSGPTIGASYSTFDADGEACDMPADNESTSITGDLTIEIIIYPSYVANIRTLIAKGGTTSEFNFRIFTGGQPRFYRGGGEIWGSGGIAVNTWYSLAVSVASASATMYRNGAADGAPYGVSVPANGTGVVSLARQGTYYYTGRIVRVRIYNRALSGAEIAANYARDKIVLAGRGISLP